MPGIYFQTILRSIFLLHIFTPFLYAPKYVPVCFHRASRFVDLYVLASCLY